MPGYKVSIDPDALQDIQDATDWYDEQLAGLGGHFQKQVKIQIGSLKKNALGHSVRYEDVRCMLIKRFPFLVHYRVNESKETSKCWLLCTPVETRGFGQNEETTTDAGLDGGYNSVNLKAGYQTLEIRSPKDIIGYETGDQQEEG